MLYRQCLRIKRKTFLILNTFSLPLKNHDILSVSKNAVCGLFDMFVHIYWSFGIIGFFLGQI